MMPRSLISFKAGACLLIGCWALQAATVSGKIQLDDRSRARHEQDIVVWLEPVDGTPIVPVQSQHARMLQKNKMFHPHVLPITLGTSVDFPNADPIFHSAFSNYDGQIFDVGLYPPETSKTIRFRKPGVVRVFCNIHPSMAAIILVLNTPYFAIVSKDGSYRIPKVPAGQYQVHFFDERATEGDRDPGSVIVAPESAGVTGPTIHISEAGYVNPPHKNKYGKDYPPDADSYGTNGPPK